jgi:hypothetical protein
VIVDSQVVHFVVIIPDEQLAIVPIPYVTEWPVEESHAIRAILIERGPLAHNRDHLIACHSLLDLLKGRSTRVRTGQKESRQHCDNCQRCQYDDNAPAPHPRILTSRASGSKRESNGLGLCQRLRSAQGPPLLPVGFHPLTMEEVRRRCAHNLPLSSRRTMIMHVLEVVVARLCKDRFIGHLWIDGRFLTEKIDPDDVDLLLSAIRFGRRRMPR